VPQSHTLCEDLEHVEVTVGVELVARVVARHRSLHRGKFVTTGINLLPRESILMRSSMQVTLMTNAIARIRLVHIRCEVTPQESWLLRSAMHHNDKQSSSWYCSVRTAAGRFRMQRHTLGNIRPAKQMHSIATAFGLSATPLGDDIVLEYLQQVTLSIDDLFPIYPLQIDAHCPEP
jgi:hypothetical protein